MFLWLLLLNIYLKRTGFYLLLRFLYNFRCHHDKFLLLKFYKWNRKILSSIWTRIVPVALSIFRGSYKIQLWRALAQRPFSMARACCHVWRPCLLLQCNIYWGRYFLVFLHVLFSSYVNFPCFSHCTLRPIFSKVIALMCDADCIRCRFVMPVKYF